MTTKVCTVCKELKSLADFYNNVRSADGKGYRCKSCDTATRTASRRKNVGATQDGYRRRSLQYKYGLTMEAYEAMLAAQGGRCAICKTGNPLGEGNTTAKRSFSFAVDHCHATGRVRGLLCNQCNRGIGFLQDSVALLEAAANYLK